MIVTLVVLAWSVVGVVVGAAWLWSRHRPLRYSDRVLVNLTTGNAVEGVLVRNRNGSLTVIDASVRTPDSGTEALEVEGQVVIPAGQVEFMQVLAP